MATNYDKYGRVRNIYHPAPVQPIRNFSRPPRANANIFERWNNSVANIGRWMDGSGYEIASFIGLGFIVLVWIAFIVSAINIWIESGFWSFLFFSILGGIATYYMSMFAGGLIIVAMTIIVRILRFIFYNLITLAITLVLLTIMCFNSCSFYPELIDSTEQQNIQQVSSSTGKDTSVYGLVGNVKSFHEKNNGRWAEIATFTTDGTLETLYGKDIEDVKKIERDNEGHIVSMTDVESNDMDGGHDSETYKWSDGKLMSSTWDSPEGQTTTSYIYDGEGKLVGTHTTGFQGDEVDTTEDYEYTEFDDHGNWTSRTRKYKDGSITREFKDERTITYWN